MQTPDRFKIVNLRLPSDLDRRLSAIAARDANSMSAVIRRLISERLRDEDRSAEQADRG